MHKATCSHLYQVFLSSLAEGLQHESMPGTVARRVSFNHVLASLHITTQIPKEL